jgi:hypothetical protein
MDIRAEGWCFHPTRPRPFGSDRFRYWPFDTQASACGRQKGVNLGAGLCRELTDQQPIYFE